MPKTALIAMSGGVDSSVAAICMQQAGYVCHGVMLRLHDEGDDAAAVAEADARAVADRLGMPFTLLDRRRVFADEVIRPFI